MAIADAAWGRILAYNDDEKTTTGLRAKLAPVSHDEKARLKHAHRMGEADWKIGALKYTHTKGGGGWWNSKAARKEKRGDDCKGGKKRAIA